jgi:hypothetical protein
VTHRPRHRALWLVPMAVLAAVAACSSDDPGVSADEAAAVLADQLRLPDDQRQCLAGEFEQRADARSPLETGGDAGEASLDALESVLLTCVPAETLAANLATLLASAYSSAGGVDEAARQCLEDQILALPREQQALFVTGPVARSAALDSEASLAASELIDRVVTACGTAPAPP